MLLLLITTGRGLFGLAPRKKATIHLATSGHASTETLAERFREGLLYADNHVLAFNKPCGVLSQADRTGDACVNSLALAYLERERGTKYAAAVHRLDRPTSGAMLLATTSKAAGRLSAAFADGRVEKTYIAVLCEGQHVLLDRGSAAAVLCLARDARTASRRSVVETLSHSPHELNLAPLHAQAERRGKQLAALRYKVLARDASHTLAVVQLLTGRRHQIRAQFAALGAPVLGDAKYSRTPLPCSSSKTSRDVKGSRAVFTRALALHSARLVTPHPVSTRADIDIVAPLPARAWSQHLHVSSKLMRRADSFLRFLAESSPTWSLIDSTYP